MSPLRQLLCAASLAYSVTAAAVQLRQTANSSDISTCPGYKASNVHVTKNSLTASLTLAGPACNVYGTDLDDLVLSVVYETSKPIATRNVLQT